MGKPDRPCLVVRRIDQDVLQLEAVNGGILDPARPPDPDGNRRPGRPGPVCQDIDRIVYLESDGVSLGDPDRGRGDLKTGGFIKDPDGNLGFLDIKGRNSAGFGKPWPGFSVEEDRRYIEAGRISDKYRSRRGRTDSSSCSVPDDIGTGGNPCCGYIEAVFTNEYCPRGGDRIHGRSRRGNGNRQTADEEEQVLFVHGSSRGVGGSTPVKYFPFRKKFRRGPGRPAPYSRSPR